MILNIHVPKTAGTSFRIALEKRFGRRALAYDYGGDSPVTSGIVREYLYTEDRQPDQAGLIEALRSKGRMALIGHFPQQKFAPYFPPEEIIAFVREPLARTASEYLHRTRLDENFGESFETFIEKPKNRNFQAHTLRGLDEKAFVGLTEDYGQALQLINARFGLKLKRRRDNRSPRGGAARFVRKLKPAMIRRFYELNREDVELYGQLSARFQRLAGSQRRRWFDIRRQGTKAGRGT